MIDALMIAATAKGWLRFLPEPLRKRLSRRTLRAIMALQGVPLDGLSDAKIDSGIMRFKELTNRTDLAMAASLRDVIRDSEPSR